MNYAETLFLNDSTAIQKRNNIVSAETAFFELGTEVCGEVITCQRALDLWKCATTLYYLEH
jgi:hypothetical protein